MTILVASIVPSHCPLLCRLLFKDQYLELTTAVPADADLYGLGEVSLPTGLLLPRYGSIITLWVAITVQQPLMRTVDGADPFYLQVNKGQNCCCSIDTAVDDIAGMAGAWWR